MVAAKIDNTFPGRQWGVGAADVVYVEMVEGNLSRLIAMFHTNLPDRGRAGPQRPDHRPRRADRLRPPALMFSGGAGGPLDNFASVRAGRRVAGRHRRCLLAVVGGAASRTTCTSTP